MRALRPWLCIFLVAAASGGGATSARAQITEEPIAVLPDPAHFARGLQVDAQLGAVTFLGAAHRPLGTGAALGVRVGWELRRWCAVSLHALGSTHETDFGPAPQSDQLLQILAASAELRLGVPLGRVLLFAQGGAGFARLSSNVLTGTRIHPGTGQGTLLFVGGLGVDYHTLSRHFSYGLDLALTHYAKLEAPGAIASTAYVRYTF